jgi:hypothetical protein
MLFSSFGEEAFVSDTRHRLAGLTDSALQVAPRGPVLSLGEPGGKPCYFNPE